MRRNVIVIAAVLFFCTAVSMSAQGKPDFSGKWVLELVAPASAPGGLNKEITVKQEANVLAITRMAGDQTVTAVFNLDGSETKRGPGGAQGEAVSRATWDGNKLVIVETLSRGGGNAGEQKRVMSMEGGNLVMEITAPGRGGAGKLVYKKG